MTLIVLGGCTMVVPDRAPVMDPNHDGSVLRDEQVVPLMEGKPGHRDIVSDPVIHHATAPQVSTDTVIITDEDFEQEMNAYETKMRDQDEMYARYEDVGIDIATGIGSESVWTAHVPDTFQGQDAVTDVSLTFHTEQGEDGLMFVADIISTLSTDAAPAVRMTIVEGAYGMLDDPYTITMGWVGSRDDSGFAVIQYDLKDTKLNTLKWKSEIYGDADYTLPMEMILKRVE